jgi:hypothetical protein
VAFVGEDDAFVGRAAEGIEVDDAVAADEAFLPDFGGPEADEAALGTGQGSGAAWVCSRETASRLMAETGRNNCLI